MSEYKTYTHIELLSMCVFLVTTGPSILFYGLIPVLLAVSILPHHYKEIAVSWLTSIGVQKFGSWYLEHAKLQSGLLFLGGLTIWGAAFLSPENDSEEREAWN